MKKNILLVQLGSPTNPTTKAVKVYLKEFLSDPRVLDIPFLIRFLLLRFIILPFRSPRSAKAYCKAWLPKGSPLTIYTQRLTQKLQKMYPSTTKVEYVMRYGEPSIKSVIEKWTTDGVDHIQVVPLYPQYASCSTGSVIEKLYSSLKKKWNQPSIETIPAFYNHPYFIEALALSMKKYTDKKNWDQCIFSFHGLPERHIQKSEITPKFCLKKDFSCCEEISNDNTYCYRAHCVQTAKKVAEKLGISKNQYQVSFQSRLGRSEWIKPYTYQLLENLPNQGIKRIIAVSPSFTADCLETIEELGMENKNLFLESEGKNYTLIPCLNDQDHWVEALYKILEKK